MNPIFRYTFFLSLDEKTKERVHASRNKLAEILGISLASKRYMPHLTLFYFDRDENDEAVIKQAVRVFENVKAIQLLIKGTTLFTTKTADTIVYTFKNPEIVSRLNTQLHIAYFKRPKSDIPHITIAKDLPKSDPDRYLPLPSLMDHPVECKTLTILKMPLEGSSGVYTNVHAIALK